MIAALIGGQFGSEGKGLVAGHIGWSFGTHVRVGAANAGHTVYTHDRWEEKASGDRPAGTYVDWIKHVVQQLPCAAYAAPHTNLVLGAGALISPEILREEIDRNHRWREEQGFPALRLSIDKRAHVILDVHKEIEAQSGLIERIGSTSATAKEGIGAAQAARVMRGDYIQAIEYWGGRPPAGVGIEDTVEFLHQLQQEDKNILLEGTQGTCLSNITGHYPYVTSRCTSAPGLAAECGLAKLDEVIMVCRCHPIRVAGNSGPFWSDSEEIAWDVLGINPENERTTVTKKVRRVATFSFDQVARNARINDATRIALTFADYINAQLAGEQGHRSAQQTDEWPILGPMIRQIEERTGCPVQMIGTGPHSIITRGPDTKALVGGKAIATSS